VDISENTYFAERFGRNDFSEVVRREEIGASMAYLIKHIEKSGEKLVYSRKLMNNNISPKFQNRLIELIEEQDCRRTEFAVLVGISKNTITYATVYGIVPSL